MGDTHIALPQHLLGVRHNRCRMQNLKMWMFHSRVRLLSLITKRTPLKTSDELVKIKSVGLIYRIRHFSKRTSIGRGLPFFRQFRVEKESTGQSGLERSWCQTASSTFSTSVESETFYMLDSPTEVCFESVSPLIQSVCSFSFCSPDKQKQSTGTTIVHISSAVAKHERGIRPSQTVVLPEDPQRSKRRRSGPTSCSSQKGNNGVPARVGLLVCSFVCSFGLMSDQKDIK